MKTYRGIYVQLYIFLIWALVEGE